MWGPGRQLTAHERIGAHISVVLGEPEKELKLYDGLP